VSFVEIAKEEAIFETNDLLLDSLGFLKSWAGFTLTGVEQ
jgi:hypothetical protein